MLKYLQTFFAGAVVGLLALAAPANANTISYSGSYGPAATDWNNGTQTVSINKFNSSLGVLTGVSVVVSETVASGSLTVTPTNGSVTANPLTAGVAIAVINPFVSAGSCTPTLTFANCFSNFMTMVSAMTLSAPNVDITTATNFSTTGATATSTGANESDLSDYIGSGSITMELLTSTNLTGSFNGNATLSQTTNDSATVTVTYTYSTPEPASLSILGLGVATLGFLRRRKTRR